MAVKSGETQRLIDKFCAYIDELIDIWENAETRYIENKNFAGIPANFLSIKLGLSKLGGDMPYKPEDWDYASLEVHKKIDKGRTQGLRSWQRKARQEGKSKAKWCRIKFDKKKAEKLSELLEEMIYSLKAGPTDLPFHAKGLQANDLAFKLGLIDQHWYIAMKLGLPLRDTPTVVGDKVIYNDKWNVKTISKALGIPLNGVKPPYIANVSFYLDSWTDIKTLQEFKKKVKALLESKDVTISEQEIPPPEVRPIPIEEEKLLAFAGGQWHRITPAAMDIIKKLNDDPGAGLTGEQLKGCPGSEERPDRIIKKMPEPILTRIKNTPKYGYHLI